MTITSDIDARNDLTIFTVKESPIFDEFMAAVEGFYSENPTKNVLWDFTQAMMWDISGLDIEKMAAFAPRLDEKRSGAKTAIVASDEMTQALSELFVLFGSANEVKVTVELFPSRLKAMEWLSLDS